MTFNRRPFCLKIIRAVIQLSVTYKMQQIHILVKLLKLEFSKQYEQFIGYSTTKVS